VTASSALAVTVGTAAGDAERGRVPRSRPGTSSRVSGSEHPGGGKRQAASGKPPVAVIRMVLAMRHRPGT